MAKLTLFLGGTTDNDYRDGFTSALVARSIPSEQIFNPVVKHWNEEAQHREEEMKANPSVMMLYYLTGNEDGIFLSFYSLHEAEMGLYDDPARTAIVFDYTHLVPRAAKRLKKVFADLTKRFPNAPIFESLSDAEEWFVKCVT